MLAADRHIEATRNRLAWVFELILLSDVSFRDSTRLATRTSGRQRNIDNLIEFLVGGHIATSLLSVVVTGLAVC